MIGATLNYQIHAATFCPMEMHAVTLTVPVPLADGGVEGQLRDRVTDELLFDKVTGLPIIM